jgi:hypothetical protein
LKKKKSIELHLEDKTIRDIAKEEKDCLYPQMIKAIKKVRELIILVFSPTNCQI